jgi:hypothetical protein
MLTAAIIHIKWICFIGRINFSGSASGTGPRQGDRVSGGDINQIERALPKKAKNS